MSEQAEYASHMPVLEAALRAFQPKSLLEVGSGYYSSPIFYQSLLEGSLEKLTIVEQSDVNWLHNVQDALGEHEGLTYDFLPTSVEVFDHHGKEWDMVFVDGETGQRRHAVQIALNADIPVVIFHDSEKMTWYGYNHIVKPEHYFHRHYQHLSPEAGGKCTCVISLESVLLEPDLHRAIIFGTNQPLTTVELP